MLRNISKCATFCATFSRSGGATWSLFPIRVFCATCAGYLDSVPLVTPDLDKWPITGKVESNAEKWCHKWHNWPTDRRLDMKGCATSGPFGPEEGQSDPI